MKDNVPILTKQDYPYTGIVWSVTHLVSVWIEQHICDFREWPWLPSNSNTISMTPFPKSNTTILTARQIYRTKHETCHSFDYCKNENCCFNSGLTLNVTLLLGTIEKISQKLSTECLSIKKIWGKGQSGRNMTSTSELFVTHYPQILHNMTSKLNEYQSFSTSENCTGNES